MYEQSVVSLFLKDPPRGRAHDFFDAVAKNVWHFEESPYRLVAYIAQGMEYGHSVLAAHILQLSQRLQMPLEVDKVRVCTLPFYDFICPRRFSNMKDLVFRGSSLFRH